MRSLDEESETSASATMRVKPAVPKRRSVSMNDVIATFFFPFLYHHLKS